MSIPLLIVTPQISFGSLVRKGLDAAKYDLLVTTDFSEAIHHVRRTNCPVAILDAELDDVELSVLDIGFALRQIKSDIQFILVTRTAQDANLGPLTPAATFNKPIALPELNKLLDRLTDLTPSVKPVPAFTPTPTPAPVAQPMPKFEAPIRTLAETSRLVWIKDVSKAAQQLTRLTLESSAQAALITRENELWAYAGQLSRDAAQELVTSIQRYWDRENDSDLLRFIRLQSTEAQHILYARKLSNSMILALVFDGETSFSTIRTQAGKLVKNLAEEPMEDTGQVHIPVQPAAAAVATPAPAVSEEFLASEPGEEEEDLPPISELLGEVPPPIPTKQQTIPVAGLPWEHPAPVAQEAPRLAVDEPKTEPPHTLTSPLAVQFSHESSPPVRRESYKRPLPAMDETMAGRLESSSRPVPALDETQISSVGDEVQLTRKQTPQKDQSLIETRQSAVAESVTEVAHRILLEPASPAMANLAYACLLIPRFDTHHLVGDTAERLTEWVPQVCIAFGWRLEHLAVRPDYLQWVARVPPSTAPGYIMRIIRQQTSDRMFNEFPRFRKDNPSGDFWAPGYLIMGSPDPHPQKLVRDFIKHTRERQGLGYE